MTGFLSQMRQNQRVEQTFTDKNGQKRTETDLAATNGSRHTPLFLKSGGGAGEAIYRSRRFGFFSREKKFFASPGSHAFTKSAWGDRGRQICDRGWYDRGVRGGRGF